MWTAWESFATYSQFISKFRIAEKIYKVPSSTYLLGACSITCSGSSWCRAACLKGSEEAMGMCIGAERNKTRCRTRSIQKNCTHPQRRTLHLAEVQELEHYIFQFDLYLILNLKESSSSVFLFLNTPKRWTLKPAIGKAHSAHLQTLRLEPLQSQNSKPSKARAWYYNRNPVISCLAGRNSPILSPSLSSSS